MAPTTWRDAEIELSESRLRAIREADAALGNIRPWLSEIERVALGPAFAMLHARALTEQEKLDAQEAAIRHEAS